MVDSAIAAPGHPLINSLGRPVLGDSSGELASVDVVGRLNRMDSSAPPPLHPLVSPRRASSRPAPPPLPPWAHHPIEGGGHRSVPPPLPSQSFGAWLPPDDPSPRKDAPPAAPSRPPAVPEGGSPRASSVRAAVPALSRAPEPARARSLPPPLPQVALPHLPASGAATEPNAPSVARRRAFHIVLFVAFFAGALALTLRGFEFYSLGLGERVDHPDFRVLGPGSNVGHGYGIAGTLLMLTNLLYLLRRRFARLSVGSLRVWLDIHVFTGLFGGLLSLFHSAFQVRSSIAWITVLSLGAVLFTGLLGRYLHALAPPSPSAALERALASLEPAAPGLAAGLRRQLSTQIFTELPAHPSLMGALRLLPVWRRQGRNRAAIVDRALGQSSLGAQPATAEPLQALKRALRTQARARAAGALLRSWRGVHRLSALVLVAVVALHIAVAWYFGFMWVFSA